MVLAEYNCYSFPDNESERSLIKKFANKSPLVNLIATENKNIFLKSIYKILYV